MDSHPIIQIWGCEIKAERPLSPKMSHCPHFLALQCINSTSPFYFCQTKLIFPSIFLRLLVQWLLAHSRWTPCRWPTRASTCWECWWLHTSIIQNLNPVIVEIKSSLKWTKCRCGIHAVEWTLKYMTPLSQRTKRAIHCNEWFFLFFDNVLFSFIARVRWAMLLLWSSEELLYFCVLMYFPKKSSRTLKQ